MTKTEIKFTYEDYLQLSEDRRCELIEGEFHRVPSPSEYHQRVSGNLEFVLRKLAREHSLGMVYDAPFDIVLSDENVVQPDILFISKERSHIITEKNVQGAPDLVIEITSNATERWDRGTKRKLYAKFGVREYWIVDPDHKTIEVMTRGKSGFVTAGTYNERESLVSPLLKGLSVDLNEVF
jgi:Uma2 family endonuclease